VRLALDIISKQNRDLLQCAESCVMMQSGQATQMSRAISIIVPTYKERENIPPLVERTDQALDGRDYEIVFVDDNSQDGTEELVATLSKQYPVRVMVRKDEKGLASAVVHGIDHTEGGTIVVMDADLQHPPEVLPALLNSVNNGVDIAIASRYVPGGGCGEWGLIRKIISAGAIILAHLLLPTTRVVKDPMSGFFAFKRKVVDKARLKPSGYKILLEVLMEGDFQNVAEVPFNFQNRQEGESKLNARQQIEYLRHIASLMWRKGEMLRFVKFCLVGGSGVVVNEGLLWLFTEKVGLPYLASAAIAIETSILSNFVLNNYFTFRQRNEPGIKAFFIRMWKFNMVSLAGLGINLGVLALFTEVFGIYYLLANLVGITVAFLWNYLVNTWWTWR
jgi:dolichol-phosphate mannosyltransferase